MQSVLGLDLPFLHYREDLVEEEDGTELINYSRFLSRFQVTPSCHSCRPRTIDFHGFYM